MGEGGGEATQPMKWDGNHWWTGCHMIIMIVIGHHYQMRHCHLPAAWSSWLRACAASKPAQEPLASKPAREPLAARHHAQNRPARSVRVCAGWDHTTTTPKQEEGCKDTNNQI
jgi:hypothetical protein